jgi:SAM-dependent methyltransferase
MAETLHPEDTNRFEFGKNWRRFLPSVDDSAIAASQLSLQKMLGLETLEGRSFLDVGSGSGLSSLAARRLGAKVTSFDYDAESVRCTAELREAFAASDPDWQVSRASILDPELLRTLGTYDIVYSWGVLHHTGQMMTAIERAAALVAPGGQLYIAIYNDQGWISRYWLHVKRTWVGMPAMRGPLLLFHAPYLIVLRAIVRRLARRGRLERGMRLWYDTVDWLGGYPFEVARPEVIVDFLSPRGFSLRKLRTCGGRHGCNEFVFHR